MLRTLTIVKTDLSGFTERVRGLSSDDLRQFLNLHQSTVRPVIVRHRGTIVKTDGDSFLAYFDSSTEAIRSCIELQATVGSMAREVPGGGSVIIRCAVSSGDVLVHENDIFGTPVNLAARLEAMTPGGEIWFTDSVYQNLNQEEIAAEPIGELTLKGIPLPVRAYRTTVRIQTREMTDVTVLMTDLAGFTTFAMGSRIEEVERVLAFWHAAHHAVAAEHAGVIRMVIGDGFVVTFSDPMAAIRSWRDLVLAAHRRNAASEGSYKIKFGAGASRGLVRVFRSSIYGLAMNHAAAASDLSRSFDQPSVLVEFDPALYAPLPAELRCRRYDEAVSPAHDASRKMHRALSPDVMHVIDFLPDAMPA